jgi:hypothetical protein
MSKISKSGITVGQIIRAEHLLRIIDALSGEVPATQLEISGSVTASFFVGNGSQLTNLPTGSGGGTPGGSNTQIQFNSGSTFSGSANFRYNYDNQSLAQGENVTISGSYSHAEGYNTQAIGIYSHAEGFSTIASGSSSHAEGRLTKTTGSYSHAEGESTRAIGNYSHAEGSITQAIGLYSHAEGNGTQAIGEASHAEGDSTQATGSYSHTEGLSTIASGEYSHAEGNSTQAIGEGSHAEGTNTQAIGIYSHAEGFSTIASGEYSHAEGLDTITGYKNFQYIDESTEPTIVSGSSSQYSILGNYTTQYTSGTNVRLYYEGSYSDDIIYSSSFSEGITTIFFTNTPEYELLGYIYVLTPNLYGNYSHAEGRQTVAAGDYSHAEGSGTIALIAGAHAEGYNTQALGLYSHAEGSNTIALGSYSHAEGNGTIASGSYSHAEGQSTKTSGSYSHAEGFATIAIGTYSHAEGLRTIALGDYSHVQGQYNISSSAQSAFIIGNGVSEGSRSNLVFASGSQFQITGSLNVTGPLTTTGNITTSELINAGTAGLEIIGNTNIILREGNANVDNGIVVGTTSLNNSLYENRTTNFVLFRRGWSAISGSNNLTTNALHVSNSINYVSSSGTNIARGLYINPTLTGVSDYRAIQTTTGSVIFNGNTTITGSLNVNGTLTATSFGSTIEGGSGGDLTIRGNQGLILTEVNGNQSESIIIGTTTNNVALNGVNRNFVSFRKNWVAVSGSSDLTVNALNVNNTVNFVSSSGDNIARGLYINPTLTGVSDYRAIQTTTGSVIFNGNTTVTGSLTVKDIIQLERRTTTPTPVEGMIIASGSAGSSVLYYYNGTTWNALF